MNLQSVYQEEYPVQRGSVVPDVTQLIKHAQGNSETNREFLFWDILLGLLDEVNNGEIHTDIEQAVENSAIVLHQQGHQDVVTQYPELPNSDQIRMLDITFTICKENGQNKCNVGDAWVVSPSEQVYHRPCDVGEHVEQNTELHPVNAIFLVVIVEENDAESREDEQDHLTQVSGESV
jgi:hypothetical protein